MKIEKLNENKLKITLDSNDLKTRNIDLKSFISNTPESQDLFWDIMQDAEKEFGFNVDESMVYVEAHVNPTGNFTLTITKSNQNTKAMPKPKEKSKNFKLKRKEESESLDNSVFEFTSIDNLRSFSKIASEDDFANTSLYEYNKNYYLYVEKCFDNTILEYSNKMYNKSLCMAKIEEYGKTIIPNDALNQIKSNLK